MVGRRVRAPRPNNAGWMSDTSRQYGERASFADFGGRRPAAFVDAGRHTARVQFLRRAIVVSCISAFALLGFVLLFDPMHRLELGFSVGRVGLEGTRITMERPRLSGYRENGQPYEIKARTVVQDTAKPKVFELAQIDAKLRGADGSTTRIEALKGLYNTANDLLELSGIVRVRNEGHYDMTLKSALVKIRESIVESPDPVTMQVPGGRIEADSVVFSDAEDRVAFAGSVHSVFESAETGVRSAPSGNAEAAQ
jgi:lipopolysaccharide export system protein LptC